MLKVLLCDDEPLVLIGLQSMIPWAEYGMEICATVRNGAKAIEYIDNSAVDIVIADIKMPVKSGLEVAEYCRNKYGEKIQFIILTSFEELEYLKQAIKLSVIDYLIKVELNSQTLVSSLKKAADRIAAFKIKQNDAVPKTSSNDVSNLSMQQVLRDKFFSRLINRLFESEAQYMVQKSELHINDGFFGYAAVCVEILQSDSDMNTKSLTLYSSTLAMVRETAEKFCSCHIITLDTRHFVLLFCLDSSHETDFHDFIDDIMKKILSIVHNYFSVMMSVSIGSLVKNLYDISDSYDFARQLSSGTKGNEQNAQQLQFNLSVYRQNISRAFDEMDATALKDAMNQIADCIEMNPALQIQAMDAVSRILYMAMSLLQDGENIVSKIFAGEADNYRCLYQLHSCAEISWYLTKLSDGLCSHLRSKRQDYKTKLICDVQSYIKANISSRLNLNDTAALFNISPNYLSQLFTRYGECSFIEYINQQKIEAAKKLLREENNKVYEVAESLGFENAFYFSKVFKKYTGMSPHDYSCQVL